MTKSINALALLSALYDQLDPAFATLEHRFYAGHVDTLYGLRSDPTIRTPTARCHLIEWLGSGHRCCAI